MRFPITSKIISLLITIIIVMTILSNTIIAQNQAGKHFSLNSAQEYAIQHNYDVQNSNFDIKAAKNKLKEVMASGLPQINASIDYSNFLDIPTQLIPGEIFGGEPGSTIPVQFGKQHNATVGLSASQLIFNGSYFVGVQASKIFLQFTEENSERSKINVKNAVTQTYYLVLVAEVNRNIIQSSLDNLEKTLYEVQEHYKEGFVEETDVKQLQISVAQLKNTFNVIEEQISITYMLLKFQMGIDLEQSIILTDNLEVILQNLNIAQLVNEEFDINKNINYRMMSTQERIAELSLKNEKSKFLPTIAGFVSYQKNAQRDEFDLYENDKDWFSTTLVGVNLSVPIFNSGSKYFKIQQSKVALKQAQINKHKVEQGLQLEFSKAEIALSSAFENYKNNKDNMHLSKEVYDITLEKFSEGISSSLELIQIHNQYLKTQSNYITALSELLNAKNQFDNLFN
jgi:outer membrane protein